MTADTNELAAVTDATNEVREVEGFPYRAIIEEGHDAVSITIWDVEADAIADVDPSSLLDTCPYVTFDDLGIYPDGLANSQVARQVQWAALTWLRENGWETIADPQRIIAGYQDSIWRINEPLPVRPATNGDLSPVAVAASRIGQAEEARDQAIRDALAAGHPVTAIANAANLSRARIYQIRDGRR
ncbi:hypothetical protein [Streptomyces sp. NPDC017529]|uniref:hypothetical protein n=1 Tax=Streptomyces sp. NPDC017529 TaxID=3365000 RepID=UPI00379F1146